MLESASLAASARAPSSWRFPNGFAVIQLINMWLVGNPQENVPPLGWMLPDFFLHFDKQGRYFSKMKQVMRLVARLGRQEGVWHANHSDWDAVSITTLWSTIWYYLDPFLRTETDKVNVKKEDKSRKGQIIWRTS